MTSLTLRIAALERQVRELNASLEDPTLHWPEPAWIAHREIVAAGIRTEGGRALDELTADLTQAVVHGSAAQRLLLHRSAAQANVLHAWLLPSARESVRPQP